ncbi:hypothetical protein L1987_03007 [Smallanthus sonchifolius]|uniref:Uncharacterized protein n=1 Tax=Smallanthus sonchifolius TaxID=185202 RepID=A0ACB9K9I9_9ASTR|nr:hypothetical protein L1987_03007 [Smallanthus sonchifolius]
MSKSKPTKARHVALTYAAKSMRRRWFQQGKHTTDAALDPVGLVAIAIAHALALFVGVSMAANISGDGMTGLQGVVMEIIITFALVYTVYATAVDSKKGSLGTIAPIAIGFIVGANILAAGPFSGGSMNPARSFGPAVVSGDFSQNWIYWVGPLIGGGLAGFIFGDFSLDPTRNFQRPKTMLKDFPFSTFVFYLYFMIFR